MGSFTKERLKIVLAHYDLLLHSSFIEGGSLVIQEAQSAGLPIIASNISCHTSLLGTDYVGLHTVGSSEDVSAKLQAFFFDKRFREKMKIQLYNCATKKSNALEEQSGLYKEISSIFPDVDLINVEEENE